jgi:hypothetical protein
VETPLPVGGGFPKDCAGTYLTQEGSGAKSIWTLGADGSFLGQSSTQEVFNFSGQKGTSESDGFAGAKGVLLDFSFDSSGALLNIARVDIVLHRVGHDCAMIAGSFSLRLARIRSIPRATPGRRSPTPSRGAV